jgi:hypothetical protein
MSRFQRVYKWYRAETVVTGFHEKAGPYYDEIVFNESNEYRTEEAAVEALEKFYANPRLEYYQLPQLVLLPTYIAKVE